MTGPDRAEDPDPPAAGFCYYTPLIGLGGEFTVGHSASFSRVADPTELRATRISTPGGDGTSTFRVQMRWSWTPEASATRLVARHGVAPVGADDPAAIVTTIARSGYDRLGSWTMSLPTTGPVEMADFEIEPSHSDTSSAHRLPSDPWYVRAFSIADLDGVSLVSPGLEPTALTSVPGPHPEVTVTYSLKRPWFRRRPWVVTVRTEPPGSTVPPMVLVANSRATPLSAEDGEIIARLPASRDGMTHAIPDKMNLSLVGVRAFIDPSVEPGTLPPIRLRHPEAGAPRV
jgi:hypothetical protein